MRWRNEIIGVAWLLVVALYFVVKCAVLIPWFKSLK